MKKIVVMGSIGAVVLIVLAVFPTTVTAQATPISKDIDSVVAKLKASKILNEKINIIQQIIKTKGIDWEPGWFLSALGGFILELFFWLIGFWILLPV